MDKLLTELLTPHSKSLFTKTQADTQLPFVKPTIVIGLGGSGTKTVARLKQRMHTWAESYARTFSELRQTEGLSPAEVKNTVASALRGVVAFLAVDTLSFPNLQQEDVSIAESLSAEDYLYAGGFNPVDYISRQYAGDENLQRWWEKDFRPPYTYIDDGARRFRMLGRLALYRSREAFHNKLVGKVAEVVRLRENLVNMGLSRSTGEQLNEILVYLITGSNGGTGSGMFFDAVFHAFTAVKDVGDLLPKIRIVVVSPRIYMMKSHESGLHDALTANAYAFFQSLSLIVEKPTEAVKYVFDYHTSPQIRMLAQPLSGWRPDKVYIVDTEISGKEISDLAGMLTNAADYLYLDITTPVTIGSAQQVNFEQVLEERFKGHRRILASFGISYFLLPAVTIIKGLVALLVSDVLEFIANGRIDLAGGAVNRPRTADPAALQMGRDLAKKYVVESAPLRAEPVAQLPPARELTEWAETRDQELLAQLRGEIEADAQDPVGRIGQHGKNLAADRVQVDVAYTAKKTSLRNWYFGVGGGLGVGFALVAWAAAAETELMPPVIAALASLVLGSALGALIAHFLKAGVREAVEEDATRLRRLDRSISNFSAAVAEARNALDTAKNTQIHRASQERQRAVAVAKRLLEHGGQSVETIFTKMEADEVTSSFTSIYCWGFDAENEKDDYKLLLGPLTKDRFRTVLKTMQLSGQNTSDNGASAGPSARFRNFADKVVQLVEDKTRNMKLNEAMNREDLNNLLMAILPEALECVILRYSEQFGIRELNDFRLWDGLDGFTKDSIARMSGQFNEVRQQLRSLSDPTWAYDKEIAPPTRRIEARYLAPVAFQKNLNGVWGAVEGVLNDKRMAITVQSEFGIPIFALRGMREWKKKYETWMIDWRAKGESPPHVDKRWLEDGLTGDSGVLPVLEPNDDDKLREWYLRFLMMGSFARDGRMTEKSYTPYTNGTNGRLNGFGAFWHNIVKQWTVKPENVPQVDTAALGEEELRQHVGRIWAVQEAYYEQFRATVQPREDATARYRTNDDGKWALGDIADYWDAFAQQREFLKYRDDRKADLNLLYRIMDNDQALPSANELRRLIDNLSGIFEIKALDQLTFATHNPDMMRSFAQALSRL